MKKRKVVGKAAEGKDSARAGKTTKHGKARKPDLAARQTEEVQVEQPHLDSQQTTKANRLQEAQDQQVDEDEVGEPRGVVYLGHIPNGFFEPQMMKFFGQFGKVTRMRLSRSRRTCNPKGYAFVEFEQESVAKIVADTMNKYLLFDKTLVCHFVPPEKQHHLLFRGWRRSTRRTPRARLKRTRAERNDRPTVEVDGAQLPRRTLTQERRQTRKDKKLKDSLAALGVDWDTKDAVAGGDDKLEGQQELEADAAQKVEPTSSAPSDRCRRRPVTKRSKRQTPAIH